MGNYDLRGLSTGSFERLVQALAAKVIGPGIMVFGDGPDGGREATFEGRMPYPSHADQWEGYCVLQAKFLQRPRDAKSDGDWAIARLREELDKYADPKSKRRKPDYYIFATNVVLTPVQDTGSKDRMRAVFEEFADRVPVRDYGIWDCDQICTYLDACQEIQRTYAAWITPGDVLSEVLDWLKTSRQDFAEVMANFLAKELAADQFARLEEAGHTTDDRIPLAPVFVDVDVSDKCATEPAPAPKHPDKTKPGFCAQVLVAAQERLDPRAVQRQRMGEARPDREHKEPEPGRFVVIGGPGQGKTTLGQFICQLFRAAILRDRPRESLTREVQEALDCIINACQSERIELPRARRFPVRIVLNDFARALSTPEKDHKLTLLAYVVERIRSRTDREISPDDFRAWLREYPWLIILDGLDEVPASSNRTDVLRAVEDFWTDAAQCYADVLVVAMTRPQGYSDDFSPAYYRHQWLVPLSTEQALHYAKRLACAKFGENHAERDRVLAALEKSARHEATARLMRSPLQVTIMHTLVEHGGTPPQDRWQLFHDYYETIYRREKQRPIPAAELLQKRKGDIDRIHWRAALVLQVQHERGGEAEAKLSVDHFEQIIDERLDEEEFEGAERQQVKTGLMEAAAHRLVLLTGVEQDRIGFEIASLREFMAAEALFEGGDEQVEKRLREVAPVASWRNVLLFAAGRCFAKQQHLRDTIHTICVELNDELAGPVGKLTCAGSQLAMDLLEEGFGQRSPKYGKLLLRVALQVIDLPPGDHNERLALLYSHQYEQAFREQIEQRLRQTEPGERLGAWATLLALADGALTWARGLSDTHWPGDPEEQLSILDCPTPRPPGEWLSPRLIDLLPRVSPARWPGFRRHGARALREPRQAPHWYTGALRVVLEDVPFHRRLEIGVLPRKGGQRPVLRWVLQPVRSEWTAEAKSILRMPVKDASWTALIEFVRFARSASKSTLAECLRTIGRGSADSLDVSSSLCPWPVGACLSASENSEELHMLAKRAEAGQLGDIDDWLAAEERWKDAGITADDLSSMSDERWPFDRHIGRRGFPVATWSWSVAIVSPEREELLRELCAAWRTLSPGRTRGRVAGLMLFVLDTEEIDCSFLKDWLTIDDLHRMMRESQRTGLSGPLMSVAWKLARSEPEWLAFLEDAGPRLIALPFDLPEDFAERLPGQLRRAPQNAALVQLLAGQLADGKRLPVDGVSIDPPAFSGPGTRLAGIIIRLVQGNLSSAEATDLAVMTAHVEADRGGTIASVLRTLTEHELFAPEYEKFVRELLSQLPPKLTKARAGVIRSLNDALRRCGTRLTDRARWKELSLTEGLAELVEQS